MPFQKGNTLREGKGPIQTGSRPKPGYYSVYGAKFRQEDDTGRKFKAFLKKEGLTMRECITRWMFLTEEFRHVLMHFDELEDYKKN